MQEKIVLKKFGKNIKQFREKNNLTIKELSRMVNINENYINMVENGTVPDIPIYYAILFARAFKIKLYELCE